MPRSSLAVVPKQPAESDQPNRYNLPVQITSLVGREHEAAAIRQLLLREDIRLLTLIGPPGIGKTRLAVLVGEELLDKFSDGVYFVPLAPIIEPDLVLPAIARTFDIKESTGQPLFDTLKDYLLPRQVLLILDNFEQVAEAASQVSALVGACQGVKALNTSRVALHLYGEQEYSVPTLRLPGTIPVRRIEPSIHDSWYSTLGTIESVALFVQRARLVKSDFELTEANAKAVAEICMRLDGLPLAIELAAARIKFLSPQALLSKLEHRLEVLTSGPKDLPARQQTLRNAIEWSYDLLDDEEKRLFRSLSVFVGGCTAEAASAVVNAGATKSKPRQKSAPTIRNLQDVLASLIDKSLLKQEETGTGDQRYWTLETIREYGLNRMASLGEEEAYRRRHAEYYLAWTEQAEPHLIGPGQVLWMDKIEAEHENLRAVLKWAVEHGEAELALRIGSAVRQYWNWRAPLGEGRQWMETALALDKDWHLPERDGTQDSGKSITTQSQERMLLRAKAVNSTGLIAHGQGDHKRARELFTERLAINRFMGDKKGIAGALANLGNVAMDKSELEDARSLHEQSLALFRELDDVQGIGRELLNLGEVERRGENYGRAVEYYEETLSLFPNRDELTGYIVILYGLGLALLGEGDLERAAKELNESLDAARELGTKYYVSMCLEALARVSLTFGATQGGREEYAATRRAATLLGAAQIIGEAGGQEDIIWRTHMDLGIATTQQKLSLVDFSAAWEAGVRMSVEEAIAFASSVAKLDTSAPDTGEYSANLAASGLTARQQEVATLIAQGKSNREIADTLIVGRRTVETHIENIMLKLDFNSRTQIAVWAVEAGLVEKSG